MSKELILELVNHLKTDFVFPENLLNIDLLATFSKKLYKNFNFNSLKQVSNYRWFFPKQVHSDLFITLWNGSSVPEIFSLEGDGVLTDQERLFVGVKTADCVPVLLATKDRKIIGAVHAGWKGTVSKILEKTLRRVLSLGYKPEEIFLAIGPHIKVCCYEIKDEVLSALRIKFPFYEEVIKHHQGKVYLDLEKANLYQALCLGIPEENVWVSKDCTRCLHEVYWSHRYHGKDRGVQIAFIGKP
ncbi:peptidoglycan editing factor PgeF [Thermodesulfobacterium hveragerdense]|uniref:peptidoglycan editing factor PgeF n=1 Tax=Thermodesulfobacterium hveragerdense TaxID=53424 RepID=UPI0003FF9683|nr:peptidoglycan editing factor PgeF [Thermodesulfobacterium hveragerdense]